MKIKIIINICQEQILINLKNVYCDGVGGTKPKSFINLYLKERLPLVKCKVSNNFVLTKTTKHHDVSTLFLITQNVLRKV